MKKVKTIAAMALGGMMFSAMPLTASADTAAACFDKCERDCRLLAGDAFGPNGGDGSQIAFCTKVCVQYSCPTSRAQISDVNVLEDALKLSGYYKQQKRAELTKAVEQAAPEKITPKETEDA